VKRGVGLKIFIQEHRKSLLRQQHVQDVYKYNYEQFIVRKITIVCIGLGDLATAKKIKHLPPIPTRQHCQQAYLLSNLSKKKQHPSMTEQRARVRGNESGNERRGSTPHSGVNRSAPSLPRGTGIGIRSIHDIGDVWRLSEPKPSVNVG